MLNIGYDLVQDRYTSALTTHSAWSKVSPEDRYLVLSDDHEQAETRLQELCSVMDLVQTDTSTEAAKALTYLRSLVEPWQQTIHLTEKLLHELTGESTDRGPRDQLTEQVGTPADQGIWAARREVTEEEAFVWLARTGESYLEAEARWEDQFQELKSLGFSWDGERWCLDQEDLDSD